MIAGIKHKRKVIGSEKEKSYIKITKRRIKDFYKGELKLRPMGKPVHKPKGKLAEMPKEWIK